MKTETSPQYWFVVERDGHAVPLAVAIDEVWRGLAAADEFDVDLAHLDTSGNRRT